MAYLYPGCDDLPTTADSPLAYHPPTHPTPGYPANPRMVLARLYLQLGTFLDYYTGLHSPSLSSTLRALLSSAASSEASSPASVTSSTDTVATLHDAIPVDQRYLFPQFGVSPDWPPTFLVHGSADSAVLIPESESLGRSLRAAGVAVELRVLAGKEHSFDYEPTAQEEFSGLFDEIGDFLVRNLRR